MNKTDEILDDYDTQGIEQAPEVRKRGYSIMGQMPDVYHGKEGFRYCNVYMWRMPRMIPAGLYYRDKKVKDFCYRFYAEAKEVYQYYKIYDLGVQFECDNSEASYRHSELYYKLVAQIINKEARFLFGVPPEITLETVMNVDTKDEKIVKDVMIMQEMIDKILKENNFEDILLKAAKDCFIGKRVACVVNFVENSGVAVDFITAPHFTFRYSPIDKKKLIYFSYFSHIQEDDEKSKCRILKKEYEILRDGDGNDRCYLTEWIYDMNCVDLSDTDEYKDWELVDTEELEIDYIPADIIVNDGLTDNTFGVSDIRPLIEFEYHYNKLGCLDIDAIRKDIAGTVYTVDMDTHSTKNVRNSLGGYLDLTSDAREENSPEVGTLEFDMKYKDPLDVSMKRIKKAMFDLFDIPDIDLETMAGNITSGKALRALYWGLDARCTEKFKAWEPALRRIIEIILKGCEAYPEIASLYRDNEAVIYVEREVKITRNTPIMDDEETEIQSDLQQVAAGVMSRNAFIQKWQEKNEHEANEEIMRIALERSIEDGKIPTDLLSKEDLDKLINGIYGAQSELNLDE